jgi:pimeloyl-ACP methyl ester carboxylesterase
VGRAAYCVVGAGPALLVDSGWVSHVPGQLELFSFGRVIERLAERFTVIRYDTPGCGLSGREAIDFSFDGQVAAALAARYPERVETLVLYGTCASGGDLAPAEVRKRADQSGPRPGPDHRPRGRGEEVIDPVMAAVEHSGTPMGAVQHNRRR